VGQRLNSFVLTEILEITSKNKPPANICEVNLTMERERGSSKKVTKEWIIYMTGLDDNDNVVAMVFNSLKADLQDIE
jgi:hypothetical protein